MKILLELVKKELLLLLRDWHALLLLFAMPTIFILIMSLAMQNQFASHSGVTVNYYLLDDDQQPVSRQLIERLAQNDSFKAMSADDEDLQQLRQRVRDDQQQFLLYLPEGFSRSLFEKAPLQVLIDIAPATDPALIELFEALVKEALVRVYLENYFDRLRQQAPGLDQIVDLDLDAINSLSKSRSLFNAGDQQSLPTSVQQNVPAWLVFAMFFIAIPLSTTWVYERQQGTYGRLLSMGVARHWLLLGKMLPYYLINMLQVALMLLVGVFVVPLLGGDRLGLGQSVTGLLLMASALSFASVAYALLISNLVTTAEQATIFTGVSNILLAALGGIMVPRFIMPPLMQEISYYSPMAWGLEGFLDLFLRQGDVMMILPEVLSLAGFGVVALFLAALFMRRQRSR